LPEPSDLSRIWGDYCNLTPSYTRFLQFIDLTDDQLTFLDIELTQSIWLQLFIPASTCRIDERDRFDSNEVLVYMVQVAQQMLTDRVVSQKATVIELLRRKVHDPIMHPILNIQTSRHSISVEASKSLQQADFQTFFCSLSG